MKIIKLSLAVALSATIAFAEQKSDLGVSANVALTSNYIWRGMTQSDNSPAIQGGFDLDYKGFYLGTWGSNINFDTDASMEFDAYGGYQNEFSGLKYDIGYVQYIYPNDTTSSNFGEAYIGLSYDFEVVSVGAKASFGIKTDSFDAKNNYEADVSIPLPFDASIDAAVGKYVDTGVYYSVGIGKDFDKFNLSLSYTGMDYDASDLEDEENVVVTLSASF